MFSFFDAEKKPWIIFAIKVLAAVLTLFGDHMYRSRQTVEMHDGKNLIAIEMVTDKLSLLGNLLIQDGKSL